jgi:hypothetical protein
MAKPRKIRHRQSNKSKAKHQQHKRRGDTLFRKAFEFCQECNADVSLIVRLKENGQIYIFNSDYRWFPSQEGLVGFTLFSTLFFSLLFIFSFRFSLRSPLFLSFSFYPTSPLFFPFLFLLLNFGAILMAASLCTIPHL